MLSAERGKEFLHRKTELTPYTEQARSVVRDLLIDIERIERPSLWRAMWEKDRTLMVIACTLLFAAFIILVRAV